MRCSARFVLHITEDGLVRGRGGLGSQHSDPDKAHEGADPVCGSLSIRRRQSFKKELVGCCVTVAERSGSMEKWPLDLSTWKSLDTFPAGVSLGRCPMESAEKQPDLEIEAVFCSRALALSKY